MSESAKPPVGETLALLLDTADCPASIRTAIINHLSELYEQSNLMHPQIVRLLYPVLLKQNNENKITEVFAAAKAASAPVPFPLSVAQAQQAPTAPIAAPPSPLFAPPSQAPTAAANPFANRNPTAPLPHGANS